MKNIMFCLVAALFLAACNMPSKATNSNLVSDTEIGLRKVDLNDEKDVQIPSIQWSEDAPGTSTKIQRSYENAPPLIPHSLDGLLPITKDNNACIGCHAPEVAPSVGATSIPKSHLIDFRTGKDLGGMLSDQRFNCTQCHVPQAKTAPLVKNNFKPDFRYKDGNTTSNLLDVMNQGIK